MNYGNRLVEAQRPPGADSTPAQVGPSPECIAPETLEQLLCGGLTGHDADALRNHLNQCRYCQATLDRLSEHPAVAQWAAECEGLPRARAEPPDLGSLLQRLGDTPLVQTSETAHDERVSAKPSDLLEPPQREGDLGALGRFHVLAEVGRGGMGIVFRAYDQDLDRTVALKVLRWERGDEQARARFVREAQAAARLEHDNVVAVYGVVNPADAAPFLVMQYIAGQTLRERIEAERQLDPREAARVTVQAADGLAAAHRAGLIHRDIKPANIILDSQSGRARIMDFGLVRVKAQAKGTTQEGTIAGTPEYMSPEQVREPDRIDERSDTYSLGVTLYEALTGEAPFRGVSHMVLQQVLHDEPKALRRLNDRVPRDLETICLKAMAKEPASRYQSAGDLRDDLIRWLAGETIRARPAGRLEKGWRWCRRRPREAGLIGAVVSLVVLAVAAALWYQHDRAGRTAARAHDVAQATAEVRSALRETVSLRKRGQTERDAGRMQSFLEAYSAVQRAEGLLSASVGLVPADLAALVREERLELDRLMSDQRFITQVLHIRARRADRLRDLNFSGAERRYSAAFKAHGLDVDREAPAQLVDRLAAKDPLFRENLAVALDDWVYMRQRTGSNAQPLVEIVRLLDADPMRNRIRAAQEGEMPRARQELREIALSTDPVALPPPTVHLLALALMYRNDWKFTIQLLRAAQRRHPDDFQINHDLAWVLLYFIEPPRLDEAIRFYTVAMAIRPHNAATRIGLANAFRRNRNDAEATRVLNEFVQLQRARLGSTNDQIDRQHLADRHSDLGVVLAETGSFADAAVAFGRAVELDPDDPYHWYLQASAYLGLDDRDAHRSVCASMLERFGNTRDPAVATRVLYTCLPGRDAVADPARLVRLADIAYPNSGGATRLHGASLYRAGQWSRVIEPIAKDAYLRGWDWLFSAMAHQRLGKSTEARQCIEKAVQWQTFNRTRVPWTSLVEGKAMLREAEELLNGTAQKD